MNSLKKLLVPMLLLSLALISQANTLYEPDLPNDEDEYETDSTEPFEDPNDESTPLRGIARLLSQSKSSRAPVQATCNKYPKICRVKGSPGRDCCKKKCVNTNTDRANCGMCGHRCKYGEICCKGKCVNPMTDKKHCGGCNNKCKHRKGKCIYGMCSYA